MLIVGIKGGLGNQMFQYALYCALREQRSDVMISTVHFELLKKGAVKGIPKHGTNFLLDEVFAIDYEEAPHQTVRKYIYTGTGVFTRLLRHFKINKKGYYAECCMTDTSLEALKKLDNAYLDGYWQKFSYYYRHEEQIRNRFVFRKPLIGNNLEVAQSIQATNSVSIHVRRGDYLGSSAYTVQDEQYYIQAIRYIQKKVDRPKFFCFSDDIVWCFEKFGYLGVDITYVDWNKQEAAYVDMQLMSMCKHNIITNSSFSVWAAWLNSNDKKIVIRPKHYYNDHTKDAEYEWAYPYLLDEDT